MAQYQIVCVQRLASHAHITHVGTSIDGELANREWNVIDVRQALDDGDVFYTVSPSTSHHALVRKYDAYVNGRIVRTIRSDPDATPDNNLDNMRVCRWQSRVSTGYYP